MRALIAGGGIGGLAAAVALGQIGVDCLVLEQAPEIREVGAGLSLWANAVRVLQDFGLGDQIVSAGSCVDRALTITSRGDVISDIDLSEINARAGAPSVCAHRADLQRILAQALPSGALRTGATCTGFSQTTDRVEVTLSDGAREQGDLLIGADGIHSAIRQQLLGSQPPRYAGYVALRAVVPQACDLPHGQILFVQGRGIQLGILPCGERRTYWFATRNAPAGTRWSKAMLLDACRDWPAIARSSLAATDEAVLLQSDVIDRPPVATWGEGRVTLLGDAVHPTTPNLGQGACQALESAAALARCLKESSTLESGLRAYESLRQARTKMVTNTSWSLGRMLQWENPALVWIRDQISRSSPGRRQGVRMFRELLIKDPAER